MEGWDPPLPSLSTLQPPRTPSTPHTPAQAFRGTTWGPGGHLRLPACCLGAIKGRKEKPTGMWNQDLKTQIHRPPTATQDLEQREGREGGGKEGGRGEEGEDKEKERGMK